MERSRFKKAMSAVKLSIVGNLILAIIKAVTGYFGNSFALIADAIESTTDVFSSVMVFLGLKYASKPADENHPYGHGRIEPLVTFILVGFLLVSATVITIQSIENIQSPQKTPKGYTLIVLGVIIVVKEVFYKYIHKKGLETGSTSLRADAWHHRSDAITSLVAFIGISIAIIFGEKYAAADDWAALAAAGFITFNAYLIFRPALGEIMDEQLHHELIDQIRTLAMEIPGVKGTEKCHARKLGMYYHVDLHLEVSGENTVSEGHHLAHQVKQHLLANLPEINDVLIHVEPFDTDV
jgi:cation diffusion facilitator family transporter